MAVNIIVIAVTLLMGGFVAIWLLYPQSRTWFEAPKHQPLAWDLPSQTLATEVDDTETSTDF